MKAVCNMAAVFKKKKNILRPRAAVILKKIAGRWDSLYTFHSYPWGYPVATFSSQKLELIIIMFLYKFLLFLGISSHILPATKKTDIL